jgi:uncharacterized protein YecE (DUF72 family)
MGAILIGCSGWSYAHWRQPVYHGIPSSRWLEAYAESFPTVELNATFYRLPVAKTITGWVERAPDDFVFAVKVSRYLTHIRRLSDIEDGWRRLCELLQPMGEADKLGPLLWQLPENFERDEKRLGQTLEILTTQRHCFEFRHASWFCEPVMRLLADAGAALVIGDTPNRPFQTHRRTTDWMYVRFHHGSQGRRGNYSDAELERWARRIRRWANDGDVYAYFNNDWEAFAWKNARFLMARTTRAPRATVS